MTKEQLKSLTMMAPTDRLEFAVFVHDFIMEGLRDTEHAPILNLQSFQTAQ